TLDLLGSASVNQRCETLAPAEDTIFGIHSVFSFDTPDDVFIVEPKAGAAPGGSGIPGIIVNQKSRKINGDEWHAPPSLKFTSRVSVAYAPQSRAPIQLPAERGPSLGHSDQPGAVIQSPDLPSPAGGTPPAPPPPAPDTIPVYKFHTFYHPYA